MSAARPRGRTLRRRTGEITADAVLVETEIERGPIGRPVQDAIGGNTLFDNRGLTVQTGAAVFDFLEKTVQIGGPLCRDFL